MDLGNTPSMIYKVYSGVQIVLCHRRTLISYPLSEVILVQHFSSQNNILPPILRPADRIEVQLHGGINILGVLQTLYRHCAQESHGHREGHGSPGVYIQQYDSTMAMEEKNLGADRSSKASRFPSAEELHTIRNAFCHQHRCSLIVQDIFNRVTLRRVQHHYLPSRHKFAMLYTN
ncbi:hypothetical protein BDR07DRAFT_281081 [Suillus spraguei]|nr:hypothetical protein BDR07DRAFT_281081 [Suillus spraguei]